MIMKKAKGVKEKNLIDPFVIAAILFVYIFSFFSAAQNFHK